MSLYNLPDFLVYLDMSSSTTNTLQLDKLPLSLELLDVFHVAEFLVLLSQLIVLLLLVILHVVHQMDS